MHITVRLSKVVLMFRLEISVNPEKKISYKGID